MPERPDLRQIAGNIREALADYDRDALLEILTYVFKEYVVEGPPPLLVNQSERLEDLAGLSFGQLVAALQTRLDYPELSLFAVDGEQVSVRVGGVMTPLAGGAQAAAAAAVPEPEPAPAPAPAAHPQPGVQVVETGLVRRPHPTPAAAPAAPEARRPSGLSVRGRPSAGAGSTPTRAAQPAAPAQPGPAEPPAEAPAATEPPAKDPPDGDDASVRFSLLELD